MPALFPTSLPADADLGVAVNFFGATLVGAVSNSATAWTLNKSGAVVGQYLVCESEVVRVSAAAGAALTVVRAQDGTTAASHADGMAVQDNAVALHHNQPRLELLAAIAELIRTENCSLTGLAELFSIVGKMQAGVDAAVQPMQAAANPLISGMAEAFTLLGLLADPLWGCSVDANGLLVLPSGIRINGRSLRMVPNTAPADVSIPNGYSAVWYNEATDKLTFRIRRSDGGLITKEV